MKTVGVVALVLALGCSPAHVSVSPSARHVRVLHTAQGSEVAQCQYLGQLRADFGANMQTQETNQQNAVADLQNRTAEMSGTHLVLNAAELAERNALNQDNRVSQTGTAYRCPAQ